MIWLQIAFGHLPPHGGARPSKGSQGVKFLNLSLLVLFPVAWFTYILIYGRITKWYPYPFVDVITHGYGRVAINAVLVVAVLLVVTGLYWFGDRHLRSTETPMSIGDD